MQNKVELGREYETLWGDKVKVIKQVKFEEGPSEDSFAMEGVDPEFDKPEELEWYQVEIVETTSGMQDVGDLVFVSKEEMVTWR